MSQPISVFSIMINACNRWEIGFDTLAFDIGRKYLYVETGGGGIVQMEMGSVEVGTTRSMAEKVQGLSGNIII